MSVWTHVTASFRVDGIASLMEEPDWDGLFGRECQFDSPHEVWDAFDDNPGDFMPMGDEGTLRKSVWVNPDPSELARYTVSVFGDLRGYDNVDALLEWFEETSCGIEMLRNAVIFIECEDGKMAMDSCRITTLHDDEGYAFAKYVWGGDDQ